MHASNQLPHIYLASRSPRRRQLLEEASIPFSVVDSGIDDAQLVARPDQNPAHWAAALAYLKAVAALQHLPHNAPPVCILGADTIVVKNRRIIGQPRDRNDAKRIINSLREGSHEVITGVAIIQTTTLARTLLTDSSTVTVGTITDEQINSYLDTNTWKGKAGAYNLAERLDQGWPITCQGDPTSVMGLPMQRLLPLLRRATQS